MCLAGSKNKHTVIRRKMERGLFSEDRLQERFDLDKESHDFQKQYDHLGKIQICEIYQMRQYTKM